MSSKELGLPETVKVRLEAESKEELEQYYDYDDIVDSLSNQYGFCINGIDIKKIRKVKNT
jgi:hypothetical protein